MERQLLPNNYKMNTIRGPKIENPQKLTENEDFINSKSDSQHEIYQSSLNIQPFPNPFLSNPPKLMIPLQLFQTDNPDPPSSDISQKILKKDGGILKIPISPENKKKGIMMIQAFKRAKLFASNIKRNILLRNFKNLTGFQKAILNDLSNFPDKDKKHLCSNVNN